MARHGAGRRSLCLLSCLLVALVAMLAVAGVVRAHANLERADPPAGAVLETAPSELRLWFSETIEPRFSSVEVLDGQRRKVPVGALQVVNAEEMEVVVTLPASLANGTYTVSWRVLSRVDGHVTQGLYPLTIGFDQAPPMPLATTETAGSPPPLDVLARWINYLAAALVLGALAFGRLVLRPTIERQTPAAVIDATVAGLLRITLLGVGTLAAGAFLLLWSQAQQAGGVDPLTALSPALWRDVLGTRFGGVWLVRVVCIAVLAVLAAQIYPRRGWTAAQPSTLTWLLPIPAAGVLLLTTTLNSHAVAAAQGGVLAWITDWLHLLGASVWVGGLAGLAVALWHARSAPAQTKGALAGTLASRFSRLAVASLAVLTVTGLYQTWLHVRALPPLLETPYGRVLGAKLLLLVPVLGFGLHNFLAARRRAARVPAERVRRVALLELALLVVVLGIVGALTSLPPAWDVYRLANRGLVERVSAADLRLTLRVDPGATGLNTFDLEVRDANGQPARDVQRVTLRFRPLVVDLGESELQLQPVEEAHYRGQGGFLSLPGYWQVETIVRRAGLEDARTAVRLGVPSEPGGVLPGAPSAAGPQITSELLIGVLVFVLGVVLVLGAARAGRRRAWLGVASLAIGFALAIGGAYASTIAFMGASAPLVNPFPPDEASLQRGEQVYLQDCVMCHGIRGRGEGPLAATLNPRPVDLRLHVTAHSEVELYNWISRGVPGTPMPAYESRLTAEDRWHVLNYIRTSFDPERVEQTTQ